MKTVWDKVNGYSDSLSIFKEEEVIVTRGLFLVYSESLRSKSDLFTVLLY